MINHTFANNGFTWYKPQLINIDLKWGALTTLLESSFTFTFTFTFYSLYKNTANQQLYRYKSTHSKQTRNLNCSN